MQIVSSYQNIFSGKNKKYIFILSSAKSAQKVVKVKFLDIVK